MLDPAGAAVASSFDSDLTANRIDPTARPAGRTAILSSGRIIAAALSMVWMAVVTRHLDAGEVGSLTLGLTLFGALSVLADLGLPMVVADRVARRPAEARSLVSDVVRVRVVAGTVVSLVMVVLYRMGSEHTLVVPVAMGFGLVSTSIHSTVTAALRGLGHVVPDAVNEVGSRLLVLGLGSLLLANGAGLAAAASVFAVADVASALVLTRWARRVVHTRDVAIPKEIYSIRVLAPMGLALLVSSLHTRIDVWLLAWISSTEVTAHYAVPARVAEGLLLPAAVGGALVLPLTSAASTRLERGRRALAYVAALAGFVGAGAGAVALVAGPLLRVAFGETYSADGDVLAVLALAAVPAAIGVGLTPVMAIHARRALVACMGSALVVNLVLNLVLVPGWDEMGAAWATVASMTLLALTAVATVSRWSDDALEDDR
ncbi:oligosaccharide flippase family protein [Iamia sp. SCSIO 61187]|uniref:oligosaccharide flippase family protein n=1 Tax=Iamia sp. SCSIO 61187 TaxID=2722752 RepID=UPI001C62FB1C|nr:oligosaccharide flippase family protein [Iamia sp. SCSIO 61187]QYG93307.1 oligosaccharide flippase family protein [Iamia sp. SCSIO 61187]